MHMTINMSAGQRLELHERGDFFRLMEATQPITVQYYRNGAEVAEAVNVRPGYAERFVNGEFDRFAIVSATAQTIQIAARLGNEVFYDTPPIGNVAVTNVNGPFTHTFNGVSLEEIVLLSANPNRRYLLIQNNHTTQPLFVNLAGGSANNISGIRIPPGGSYELTGYVPTGQIIASNSNSGLMNSVMTVEG